MAMTIITKILIIIIIIIVIIVILFLIKDCPPHLFHGFRNKYFLSKFRSIICYTFIINCTSFEKMHGFSKNNEKKSSE